MFKVFRVGNCSFARFLIPWLPSLLFSSYGQYYLHVSMDTEVEVGEILPIPLAKKAYADSCELVIACMYVDIPNRRYV